MEKAGKKLLLADDSPTIHRLVKDVLMPENFEVKAVDNGEQALNELIFFQPDIVLADTDMPELDGFQLCEMIKKSPKTRKIPVILLTGVFDHFDERRARLAGAEGFLVKPFESDELINKIRYLLEEGRNELSEYDSQKILEDISTETEGIKLDEDISNPDQVNNNLIQNREFTSNMIHKEISSLSKEELLNCIYSAVKDSVRQTLSENMQHIVENISSELINTLRVQTDISIKKIISDASERIIKREIERIISDTV